MSFPLKLSRRQPQPVEDVWTHKVLSISAVEHGATLSLSDGTTVPINVAPERLAEAFIACSGSSLAQLIADQRLKACVAPIKLQSEEWPAICRILQTNAASRSILQEHPALWRLLDEPYDAIVAKPHRVYGALGAYLYTSPVMNFQTEDKQPALLRYALLSDTGGWLCRTCVDLVAAAVQLNCGSMPGHYVE